MTPVLFDLHLVSREATDRGSFESKRVELPTGANRRLQFRFHCKTLEDSAQQLPISRLSENVGHNTSILMCEFSK